MIYLGKNLKYLRKQSAKSQSDIGKLVNKGQTTIANWENEESEPSIKELLTITNYFGTSMDSIILTDMEKEGTLLQQDSVGHNKPNKDESNVSDVQTLRNEVKLMRKEIEDLKKKIK